MTKANPLRNVAPTATSSGTYRVGARRRASETSSVPFPDLVQRLSKARDYAAIAAIVRTAARHAVGADGATVILRDEGHCHYLDEDAIGPLWKGQRFPLTACIGGWSMLNRSPVVIEDIYADPRIPHGAYRRTFVQSLVIVPIRREDPIAAIGVYWATHHTADAHEIALLQALADTTSVAMENVKLVAAVEETRSKNRELHSFTTAAAHDLRSPLTVIHALAHYVQNGALSADELQEVMSDIVESAERMRDLLADLMRLSHAESLSFETDPVDVSALAREIGEGLAAAERGSARAAPVELTVEDGLVVEADVGLLCIALENLLGNAWKYTSKVSAPRVAVGMAHTPHGRALFVRDNGAGFDPEQAAELFQPFRRLHSSAEFPGTGIGLTTVHRVVARHGGRVWAEAERGAGATFWMWLPEGRGKATHE